MINTMDNKIEKELFDRIFSRIGNRPKWEILLYSKGVEWLLEAFKNTDSEQLTFTQLIHGGMPGALTQKLIIDISFSEFWPIAIEYYKEINPIYQIHPNNVFDYIVRPASKEMHSREVLNNIMKASEVNEIQKSKNR